jgi:cytochrome b561
MDSFLAPETEDGITFHEAHPLALRIWHWLLFLTITASLVFVLLGSTMFRTRNNIEMVQTQLESKGVVVSRDQARFIAHEYSDKLWMAHKWAGYGLCILIFCRILIEVFRPGRERLASKIKRAVGLRAHTAPENADRLHFLSVKTGYLVFYFIFFLMGLSGLTLAFEDVDFLKPIHETMNTVHEVLQYVIYLYILIHLIGVIRADLGKYQGIVSGMIHRKQQ